ncbi:MAG: MarR family winged helix-turn-helix transcriptional regulator [bacterium]|jgi:DNA-binding MarR family transcriptional regulator
MQRSIGHLMSILHRQAQVYINRSLKEFNITSAEYAFLLYLYKKDGATQDELSSYLYVDRAATARAIKSLAAKGLIIKNKDSTDKRFNRIYLTDKAKGYREQIRQRVKRWSEFLSEDIDEKDTAIVLSVLEKMVAKVEAANRKGMEEYQYE